MHNHDSSNSNRPVTHGTRVYHAWKGNNRFFFGGRLVFGPDVRSILFTVFLIVTPVISFSVFISPRLINEFQHLGVAVVAFPGLFTAYIIILLFLTSGRDPGIIPRNLHPPDPEDDVSSVSTDWLSNRSGASSFRPTKDVLVNGMIVRVKYCQTCMLYRPPRCSHCSICNNCVERFDHHCPWVGQCIGKRNYVFFFMFVSSTTILCLYVFAFCWVNVRVLMHTYHCNVWRALSKSPLSIILIVYTFIAAWFVGGLTSFHVYLMCTNQTTYENFRYRYDGKTNPYNRGLVRNVGEVFFRKIPKSRVNFRAEVKDKPVSSLPSLPMGRIGSPELHKKSYDVEMGVKRKAVVEGELEDVQNQIEGAMRLERCGTQPRHTNWSHQSNSEITPDIHQMAAELGKEQSTTNREKISGVL